MRINGDIAATSGEARFEPVIVQGVVSTDVIPNIVMGQISSAPQGEYSVTFIIGHYVAFKRPLTAKEPDGISVVVTYGVVGDLELPGVPFII